VPVILRIRGYRFWFYQADLIEPPHVHIGKAGNEAKYWVDPIALARAGRFKPHELTEIENILSIYREDILDVWQKEQKKRDNS
jgi:hypothetical protein